MRVNSLRFVCLLVILDPQGKITTRMNGFCTGDGGSRAIVAILGVWKETTNKRKRNTREEIKSMAKQQIRQHAINEELDELASTGGHPSRSQKRTKTFPCTKEPTLMVPAKAIDYIAATKAVAAQYEAMIQQVKCKEALGRKMVTSESKKEESRSVPDT